MTVDHCLFGLGLHRVEVNIRPENSASLRVAHKLGFRYEGRRRRYLHIDGDWRDHETFALTVEDVPGGLLTRWRGISQGQGLDGDRPQSHWSHPSPPDSPATHR